jgi:hypothetical protein
MKIENRRKLRRHKSKNENKNEIEQMSNGNRLSQLGFET